MNTTVRLQHITHRVPKRYEHFYDGFATAEDGLISLDSGKLTHIRTAYFRGYQMTPDGRWLRDFRELDEYVASLTAESEKYEQSKSDDSGRQPDDKNRVRSRQRNRG